MNDQWRLPEIQVLSILALKSQHMLGEYFDRYISNDYSPRHDKIKMLFEGIYIPTQEDWEKLKEQVMRYGLTNSYRLAIAPTGSISYVQSSTAL